MGASSSTLIKTKKSRPKDVHHNLSWSLAQLMIWEDKFDHDSIEIYGQEAAHPEEHKFEPSSSTEVKRHSLRPEEVIETKLREDKFSELPSPKQEFADSNSLGAHAIFIRKLLRQLVDNAEYTIKLRYLISSFSKRLTWGAVRKAKLRPKQKQALQMQKKDVEAHLASALGNFDNACVTLAWLYKKYDILFRMKQINNRLKDVAFTYQKLHEETREVKTRSETAIEKTWGQLLKEKAKLKEMLKENERQCLSLGLYYLDKEFCGELSAKSMREMRADLFARLDVDRSHKVSPKELHRAIKHILSKIAGLKKRIKRLEAINTKRVADQTLKDELGAEYLQTLIDDCQEHIDKLKDEVAEEEDALDGINRFFHNSVAHHVFNKMMLKVDVTDAYFEHLLDVRHTKFQDPLRPEEVITADEEELTAEDLRRKVGEEEELPEPEPIAEVYEAKRVCEPEQEEQEEEEQKVEEQEEEEKAEEEESHAEPIGEAPEVKRVSEREVLEGEETPAEMEPVTKTPGEQAGELPEEEEQQGETHAPKSQLKTKAAEVEAVREDVEGMVEEAVS